MKVIEGVEEMRAFSEGARARGETVVLVPTMGFLHGGHVELIRIAKRSGTVVVLSIFVNPTQFGPGEDFGAYPRDLERDLRIAASEGVGVVFAPGAGAMYPEGFRTHVDVGGLTERLCGISRPAHFRGVATVVVKLFNITRPHKMVFGKKDFQQLLVIKRVVKDLNIDADIIEAETVREPDGLAMSSRNAYLGPEERKAAASIPRALDAAGEAVREGIRESSSIIERARGVLGASALVEPEYIKVCDPETLEDVEYVGEGKKALYAVAARVGTTRLIDNAII